MKYSEIPEVGKVCVRKEPNGLCGDKVVATDIKEWFRFKPAYVDMTIVTYLDMAGDKHRLPVGLFRFEYRAING